jgi:hypothetical protein
LLCRQQSCVGPLMSPTQNQASPNQCRLVLTCWPVLGLVTQYLSRLPVLNFERKKNWNWNWIWSQKQGPGLQLELNLTPEPAPKLDLCRFQFFIF